MKRILTVALLTTATAGLGSTAAFADPPPGAGLPGELTGPNSVKAKQAFPGSNFGHCQSFVVKVGISGSTAQLGNPALFTAGQTGAASVLCPQ